MKQEFRVIWQREGQEKKRVLYQTHVAALRCAKTQETAREDMTWLNEPGYADLRPAEIVFGPIIQVREVSEWD